MIYWYFWCNRWVSLGKSINQRGSYVLKQGNPLQKIKYHSQLLNIFILLSFFASLSRHFKVLRVEIWLYWDFGVKYGVIRGNCWPLRHLRPETGEYLANFKTTNNYLIILFYYHFLLYFLVISRSIELIFDYIDIFRVGGEVILGICRILRQLNPEKGEYLAKFYYYSQLPNFLFCYHFYYTFSSFQGPQSWDSIILRFFE